MLDGRFAVQASYETSTQSGAAKVEKLTDQTGYLWFFDAVNVEAVTKLVGGCTLYAPGGLGGTRWSTTRAWSKTIIPFCSPLFPLRYVATSRRFRYDAPGVSRAAKGRRLSYQGLEPASPAGLFALLPHELRRSLPPVPRPDRGGARSS
jgi:hypothetical protein